MLVCACFVLPAAGGEWDVEGNLIVLYVLACAYARIPPAEIVTACGYPATDRWEYQITPTDIARRRRRPHTHT